MSRNKKNKILWGATLASLVSLILLACPSSPAEPSPSPSGPTPAERAQAALDNVGSYATNFKFDGADLTFSLVGGISKDITNVNITATSADIKSINVTAKSGSANISIKNATDFMVGSFGSEMKFTVVANPGVAGANKTKNITVPAGSWAQYTGTLQALNMVAGSLTNIGNGGTINTTAHLVNTLNSGSVGTLFSKDGSIVSLNAYTAMAPEILLSGGSVVAGSVGTLATTGVSAGSFTLGSASMNGTLAITDYGSVSSGGKAGTFIVYFGTDTTSKNSLSVILTSGGIKYNVPQFGVLVTLNR
jgi:hypothetical protein